LPTLTPTLAATLTAVPGTITGVVKYEKHPDQTGIAITILSGGAQVAQGQSTADGSFQFSNVPAGQYLLKFSAPGYLSASATIDVQPGQGASVQVTLMAGDIDNNGVVDLADAGFIGANYGVQAPPAPAQADLNGDGFINLVDLVLVGKNFGK
jgi:Carboxypeptidase regulatory-like domain/Dockerin type I domain